MSRQTLGEKGSSFVLVLFALTIIGGVVMAGMYVYNRSSTSKNTTSNTAILSDVPAKITSRSDLQKTATALKTTDVSGSVDLAQLNQDLSSLL